MPASNQMYNRVVVKSPINIALIKYWGKDDEERIIPCNSSISITLDTGTVFTKTEVAFGPEDGCDSFELNGKAVGISSRMRRCIDLMRTFASSNATPTQRPIVVRSENNFPTAAGMASSASGISALVYALWKLFGLESCVSMQQLTEVARLGSGSACRSILPGFVIWHRASPHHEHRSFAESLAGPVPDLNIFIYIFSAHQKETSSSEGMQLTKRTSSLFRHRVEAVVPERIPAMMEAIHENDWSRVFELTIRDSNSFHACCLDTFPPIRYLNQSSFKLIDLVCGFNAGQDGYRVGYSFDAGANGFVFLQDHTVAEWSAYVAGKLPEPIRCRMGNGVHVVDIE